MSGGRYSAMAIILIGLALGACLSGTRTIEAVTFHGAAMVPVSEGTYVDPSASDEARAGLRDTYTRAERRNADFYGTLRSERPLTVFCATDECRVYFTGPARRSWNLSPGHSAPGATFTAVERQTIVIDYLDARTENTLTHELSHVELQFRIRRGRVPEWFNEGIATFVGQEPDCSRPMPNAVGDLRTVASHEAWLLETSLPKPMLARTYCQAYREVAAWIAKNGKAKLLGLLEEVHGGTSFDDAYGPLLTQ
jgi:hypothetical protein